MTLQAPEYLDGQRQIDPEKCWSHCVIIKGRNICPVCSKRDIIQLFGDEYVAAHGGPLGHSSEDGIVFVRCVVCGTKFDYCEWLTKALNYMKTQRYDPNNPEDACVLGYHDYEPDTPFTGHEEPGDNWDGHCIRCGHKSRFGATWS